jgi:hypothetical protein
MMTIQDNEGCSFKAALAWIRHCRPQVRLGSGGRWAWPHRATRLIGRSIGASFWYPCRRAEMITGQPGLIVTRAIH